ncbi:MAG: hypothetical protein ACKO63_09650 [Nodosilinea sp.]
MIALVGGLGVVGLGLAHRAQVWQPAYVRPLWPVYPQIAAQADRYAALARVEGATVLGYPAAQRYPDCGASFARNPWDLIAWRDRLYIGLGDSSNEGPSSNLQACSPMNQVSGTLVVTPATLPGSSGE